MNPGCELDAFPRRCRVVLLGQPCEFLEGHLELIQYGRRQAIPVFTQVGHAPLECGDGFDLLAQRRYQPARVSTVIEVTGDFIGLLFSSALEPGDFLTEAGHVIRFR